MRLHCASSPDPKAWFVLPALPASVGPHQEVALWQTSRPGTSSVPRSARITRATSI